MSRASFAKRDREQAKRTKAEAKRQRRQQQTATPDDTPDGPPDAPVNDATTAELLDMIERVHELHRQGEMSDEEFQTTKTELLGRLTID